MKIVVSMFAAMLVMTGSAAAGDLSATQKKLVDVEAAWSTAFVHKDVAVLSSTIADDWTGQNDSGKTETKAGLIASVKSGEMAITSMTKQVRDIADQPAPPVGASGSCTSKAKLCVPAGAALQLKAGETLPQLSVAVMVKVRVTVQPLRLSV